MKLSRCMITVMCITLVSFFLIGCSCSYSIGKPTVVFCDSVTDNGEPVGRKTTAPLGKYTALLTSSKGFGLSKVRVTLLQKVNNSEKEIQKTDQPITTPEANRIWIPVEFFAPGTWIVVFSNPNGEEIARGTLEVTPAK